MKINFNKYTECINPQNRVSFDDGDLGGCNIMGDPAHELPKMTKYLIEKFGIKSVLDIGCGFGFHSKFFKDVFGLEVLGIEGSSKVVEFSVIPNNVINHDYKLGSFIPDKNYDLCWSIEFVEHVEPQYKDNFLKTFQSCKYLAMTHAIPNQGGHHHVNEQLSHYWISELSKFGFELMGDTTNECRQLAKEDNHDLVEWLLDTSANKAFRGPSSENYNNNEWRNCRHTCYFINNGLFFKNRDLT